MIPIWPGNQWLFFRYIISGKGSCDKFGLDHPCVV
jgi:hypothetical protein